ncbi:MAG: PKD domain-containing protein [Desulfobacteraceae bacterium]|nr:PKD domain-containing protein [Desulfobacteraceae bacterium]MDH3721963.1 PKD domain-containing protein [Desulfobacteraceae bacterium]MDH3839212.1 PKD domain-containing protein [Desulfobacteraceae bacterium]
MAIIFRKHPFIGSFLFWFIFSTLALLFLPGYNSLASIQTSLEWAPNNEPDLAGYRVFCREQSQSYDYANPSWEGTDSYCTIYDLDETKTYCFVVRAFDTERLESGNSNEVCHEPLGVTNQALTADAGPDQIVNEGQIVLLNGSNSTGPDDGIASYHWVQIGEPTVNLSDPDVSQPTFTAPDVGSGGAALIFELTVIDPNGNQGKDLCTVNVTWQNEPPQANAGKDQTVDEGFVVTLDGSFSLDIDDGITSYLWTQIGVPTVTLSNPASSQPTFTAPDVGPDGFSLTFNLTVTDTGGLENTDSCVVNISWQNEPPTAVVATNYMEPIEETLVKLDGAASMDPDDGIASHLWSQVDGDPVSIADPASAVTNFTAPKSDQHGKNLKFRLTVYDFGGLQGTADSYIYVRQNDLRNNPPAADYNFAIKRKVASFTDNGNDTDGTVASWFWNFGDGKTSTQRNPNHRDFKFGNYSVTLTVTNDGGTSNYTSKTVFITK